MSKIFRVVEVLLFIMLIVATGFLFLKYESSQKALKSASAKLQKTVRANEVAQFNKMFIDKVLLGNKQISFEERLELENAVRELNDGDILNQWNRFVESKDEAAAQGEVKKLLQVMVGKIASN